MWVSNKYVASWFWQGWHSFPTTATSHNLIVFTVVPFAPYNEKLGIWARKLKKIIENVVLLQVWTTFTWSGPISSSTLVPAIPPGIIPTSSPPCWTLFPRSAEALEVMEGVAAAASLSSTFWTLPMDWDSLEGQEAPVMATLMDNIWSTLDNRVTSSQVGYYCLQLTH